MQAQAEQHRASNSADLKVSFQSAVVTVRSQNDFLEYPPLLVVLGLR